MVWVYNIRFCKKEDEADLVRIYHEAFVGIDGIKDIGETTSRFMEKVKNEKVLVATDNSRILGFAGYDLVRNVPPSLVDGRTMEDILNREIQCARQINLQTSLREYLQRRKEAINCGEMEIKSFENEFTTSTFLVSPKDVYCTEMAVIPELRRNGVGKVLIQVRERIARELGSATLYVHCWCGGSSPQAYQNLDFKPILRMGPEYEDGSASLLFGKLLR